eukprot:435618_1
MSTSTTQMKQRNKVTTLSFLNVNARKYDMILVTDICEIIFVYYHDESPVHWTYCTPDIGITFESSDHVSKHTNNIAYFQGDNDNNYRGNVMCNYWIKPNTERHIFMIKTIGPIHSCQIGFANSLFDINKANYLAFIKGAQSFKFGLTERSIIDNSLIKTYDRYWESSGADLLECLDGTIIKLVINSNAATASMIVNNEKFVNDGSEGMHNIFGPNKDEQVTLVGWIFSNYYRKQ